MTTATRMWGIVLAAALFSATAAVGPMPQARADGFIVVHQPGEEFQVLPMPMPRPHPHPRFHYMPLEVKNHLVDADITDNIGVTRIDQTFHNPNNSQMEGTYIFPVADDVTIQKFSMFMDGKEVRGEVLDKDKARQIYEDIVRKAKDPALLEYVGSRMYKARVFPIPANGDVRIKIEYSQVIAAVAGLSSYRYPLNTEKYSSAPISQVAIRVKIKSSKPLATVFCPSHQASIDRKGSDEATVGYEASNVLPDKDFIVNYKTSEADFALVMLAHRESGEDGYFMARIAPGISLDGRKILAKDICFVIDTSGSMSGKKIQQAKEALRFCLNNLNPDDRFSIIAFSTEVRPYRDSLLPAKGDNLTEARNFVDKIEASGGTAINDALLAALESARKSIQDKTRPYMIVFLTDGLPTIGETNVDRILENVKKNNTGNLRLFVFGVGNDVNTRLLDKLAEDNHGSRDYVAENEDLELKLSNFYGTIANPVLSDLKLTFDPGLGVHDVYPRVLPDLFKGGELVVFGRYDKAGRGRIELAGQCGSESIKRSWDESFPQSESGHDYLPRLWATRKVGYLLDEIRLRGETKEVKEEVVQLAKRFGIVTPYTSYLIVEEDRARMARGDSVSAPSLSMQLGASLGSRDRIHADDFDGDGFAKNDRWRASSGAGAVAGSREVNELRRAAPGTLEEKSKRLLAQAEKPPPPAPTAPGRSGMGMIGGMGAAGGGMGGYGGMGRHSSAGYDVALSMGSTASSQPASEGVEAGAPIRYVGSRTFYRDGEKWVDSKYESKQETTKVKLFSDDYFNLVKKHADAAKCFALGKFVIVVLDGKAYETIE